MTSPVTTVFSQGGVGRVSLEISLSLENDKG